MQSTIPTIPPPQTESQAEPSCEIGVIVLTYPEKCTVAYSLAIGGALDGAVRRASVPIIARGTLFTEDFAAETITVPWSYRARALVAVKAILANLVPAPDRTVIAADTAEDIFLTLTGLPQGSCNFQKMFLRPEYIAATRQALANYDARPLTITRGFLRIGGHYLAAEGKLPKDSNPGSQSPQGENPDAP